MNPRPPTPPPDQTSLSAKTVTVSNKLSPYTNFGGLPQSATKVAAGKYEVSLPPVPTHICAGHFDGNPALPIAILCSYIGDLVGDTVSGLTNVPIRKQNQRQQKQNDGNSIVISEAAVKTTKLIQAESDGLTLTCTAMLRNGVLGKHLSDYEVIVKVKASS